MQVNFANTGSLNEDNRILQGSYQPKMDMVRVVQNSTAVPKVAALTSMRSSASTHGPLIDMLWPSGKLTPLNQPGQWTPRAIWPLEPLFKTKRWRKTWLNPYPKIDKPNWHDKPTWEKDKQGHWKFRPHGHGESNPGEAPTQKEEMEEEVAEEVVEARRELRKQKRKWMGMFRTKSFFDWALFFAFLAFFLGVYYSFMIGLPSKTRFHGLAVFAWIFMAFLYNSLLTCRFGVDAGLLWFNGYLMELIFSLENVFVFHCIVSSFGTPTVCAQKILFMIVCCQVLFEMILYMGLADVIDSLKILPYILGAWLTYLGIHAALESDDHDEDFDILETSLVRGIRRCLGDRLTLEYEENSNLFVYREGKSKMTMLGLVFICMLTADVLLEVDVTLTKMEASSDEYMSFTSSALAGFAVPELFFVAQDLFKRFGLLKYGISFVLVFYGLQMLFPGYMVLSPMEGCGIILIVMVICIFLSAGCESPHGSGKTLHDGSSSAPHESCPEETNDAKVPSRASGNKLGAKDWHADNASTRLASSGGTPSLKSCGGYGSTKPGAADNVF